MWGQREREREGGGLSLENKCVYIMFILTRPFEEMRSRQRLLVLETVWRSSSHRNDAVSRRDAAKGQWAGLENICEGCQCWYLTEQVVRKLMGQLVQFSTINK